MRNRDKLKKLFAIAIVLAFITSMLFTTAFAAPIGKSIEVFYNNIKIVMDGKGLSPTDANGIAVEPFSYNGTTYLPLRVIATAMGIDVAWDGATSTVTLAKKADESSKLNLTKWFQDNPNTWRTVSNGSWSNDPKDAPTDEEISQILEIACKTQTAVSWNEYYFIAVRDAKEQKAIIGEDLWKGSTSEGTVTILILADQVADQEHHKDIYKDYYMQTPMGYFDAGMACGLLNIGAYSLGYGTHYFASPSGPSITPVDKHTFGFGGYPTPNWDISRFLDGKNDTRVWGLNDTKYDVKGNAIMIGAVVVGKPNPTIDAKTSATHYTRPSNWTIWNPDVNTPPLK
jgi:hypothetical protein